MTNIQKNGGKDGEVEERIKLFKKSSENSTQHKTTE